MDYGDEGAQGFPFSACCCILLHCILSYVIQPTNIIANKGHHYRHFCKHNGITNGGKYCTNSNMMWSWGQSMGLLFTTSK
jgi:hypothetical protein